jgi:dienelactone hydrolase
MLFLLLASLLAQVIATPVSQAAPARQCEIGAFALYLPPEAATVRGVLLALGGPDTRGFPADSAFGAPDPGLEASLHLFGQEMRTLAGELGLALMGTSLRGQDGLPNDPQSDKRVLAALDEAAEQCGHPELATAPLVLYGISGGAPQAAGFTARNPGRTAALLLKVPAPPERLTRADALAVPTLMILAERDEIVDNKMLVAVFEANRRAGALWALAVEPRVPHHSLTRAHRALTVGWLRAAAELRLGSSADEPLRAVADSSGWLGHPGAGIANWGDYSRDRGLASWFPSQAAAEAWWTFVGQD